MDAAYYLTMSGRDAIYETPKSNGRVDTHREIAARTLGRKLKRPECVHHINEDRHDNRPENLLVFRSRGDHTCYHKGGTLIDNGDGTYSAKYAGDILRSEDGKRRRVCPGCSGLMGYRSQLCRSCTSSQQERIRLEESNRPPCEVLSELVWKTPTSKVAKMFDVSDTTIKNWCRSYGIDKPPRGYWTKVGRGAT